MSKNVVLLPANQMSAAEVEQILRRMMVCATQTLDDRENLQRLQPADAKAMDGQEIILAIRDGDMDYHLVRTAPKPLSTRNLSQREQEIAHLIAAGYSDKMIAHRLAIRACTVSTYVRRIFAKLAVNSRAEMVAHLLTLTIQ